MDNIVAFCTSLQLLILVAVSGRGFLKHLTSTFSFIPDQCNRINFKVPTSFAIGYQLSFVWIHILTMHKHTRYILCDLKGDYKSQSKNPALTSASAINHKECVFCMFVHCYIATWWLLCP